MADKQAYTEERPIGIRVKTTYREGGDPIESRVILTVGAAEFDAGVSAPTPREAVKLIADRLAGALVVEQPGGGARIS
jgi:hypothetical protein